MHPNSGGTVRNGSDQQHSGSRSILASTIMVAGLALAITAQSATVNAEGSSGGAAADITSSALPNQPLVVKRATLMTASTNTGRDIVGGLSGLVALDSSGTSFVAITDRGPNRDTRVGGVKGTAFMVPSYAPSLVKLEANQGELRVTERIPLRLSQGMDPVTGTAEVSGLPTSNRDEPAFDATTAATLRTDPNGVDPEGIAVNPRDGTFWIAEEYGPSLLHVASDGTILTRLVPQGLDLQGTGYPVAQLLPSILLQRKENRGFEGLTISPDGSTLFAVMQSPLSLPDKKSGEASRHIRLLTIDLSDSPTVSGMYLYRAEPASAVGAREQDDIKLGDLAAINSTRLLVTESDCGPTAGERNVYRLDLGSASNILNRQFGRPLEAMGETDLMRANVSPVEKQPVVNLAGLGFQHSLVEGLAVLDESTIAVVNDNNFDTNEPTELVTIRLPEPLGAL
jgi:Esterase-like activity of phytase